MTLRHSQSFQYHLSHTHGVPCNLNSIPSFFSCFSFSSFLILDFFFLEFLQKMDNFLICFLLGLLCLNIAECRDLTEQIPYSAINCRKHGAVLTDFGGKGDGKTSNTAAFKAAIASLSKVASDGGAQLVVPPGKWLTGSFNLVSHFTLYIHKDAVLLGSQVPTFNYTNIVEIN